MGITDLLSACATPQPYHRETYVVRPHDTLYSIAWRHNLDFRELARWNNIGPDFRLSVGQVLVLQSDRAGAHATRPSGMGAATAPLPARSQLPRASSATVAGAGAAGADAAGDVAVGVAGSVAGTTAVGVGATKWLWPTEHSAPPRAVPGGGILLFGKLGQDVRAAGAGRVVYTGSGIRGYGNLIIVKHGENVLSSYAHNREMLVHEGQDVAQGQIIARMGTAAHQIAALYFEIRLNGKPVDPLRYLPGGK